jgi:NDP-sugar pyrophosphorylase family protein/aminoglycoside/choline kinase family phosphotransferase
MTTEKINIMILAAGAGVRLRPITDRIPKPLVPVLGAPVLQHVLNAVSIVPHDRIGMNLYHKREMMQQWVSGCPMKEKIILFPEQSLTGTGGALKNAERFLNRGTFLVHNADIISDIDLSALIRHHHVSDNLVTLAVHDFPQFNNVVIDEKGFLKGIRGAVTEGGKRAFTGIAVYDPAFLEFLPQGRSSVVDAWMKAAGAGKKIGTSDVTGSYWSDIGTPASYAAAVFAKLRDAGETLYVHPSIPACNDLDIRGHVVIEEGASFEGAVTLRNCIVLPGAAPGDRTSSGGNAAGARIENCILGPDFSIDVRETDIVCFEEGMPLIGMGGSDRKYFRVEENGETAVLMQCLQNDSDFKRHIDNTSSFHARGVPVPELKRYDLPDRQAWFEDAGDLSLYSWLKCPRRDSAIEALYKKVIDGLVRIHVIGFGSRTGVSFFQVRTFDHDYFRWETDYFMQRFVKGLLKVNIENAGRVHRELDALAGRAASFPQTVVHRDFQAQNIMVLDGRDVRIIDFQGARMGPPAYDVVSLLRDPYFRLTDDVRNGLLNYYLNAITGAIRHFDKDAFMGSLLPCRLQRHMQALGAYGFLSSEKGKKYFLKFVPEGLRLLKEDLAEAGDTYPELRNLVERLRDR